MLELRGKTWYLRRRVPRRYLGVTQSGMVYLSLHTDSATAAKAKADSIWRDMIDGWEARLAGDTADAEARMAAAKNLAAARGFRFMSAKEVTSLPAPEILTRVAEVSRTSRPGRPDYLASDAILGTAPVAQVKISKVSEAFFKMAKDRIIGKSADQIRRWENPRKKAVDNLRRVLGDKHIGAITTEDMFRFREWWVEKIEDEDLTPNSANKDFTYLMNMLSTVAASKDLDLIYKTKGLKLAEGKKRTRPAFTMEWIRDKILAPGSLDGLNLEARCILLGMVNTGYRPSEAQGLLPHHIRLDADVPHISIEPEGRDLKSDYSERKIPILGVSLEAFRACPNGFPRYRDNPALSDTVNKFLRENGLLETDKHSFYSLRHAFEDRMLAAGVDERVRRDVFGHALNRERYGRGATLEHVRDLLSPIAF